MRDDLAREAALRPPVEPGGGACCQARGQAAKRERDGRSRAAPPVTPSLIQSASVRDGGRGGEGEVHRHARILVRRRRSGAPPAGRWRAASRRARRCRRRARPSRASGGSRAAWRCRRSPRPRSPPRRSPARSSSGSAAPMRRERLRGRVPHAADRDALAWPAAARSSRSPMIPAPITPSRTRSMPLSLAVLAYTRGRAGVLRRSSGDVAWGAGSSIAQPAPCGGEPAHAPIRPRPRRAARRFLHDRLRPPRRRLLPDPHGRHRGALRRERGGAGARLPARLGPGLGDGGIRHAAARHPYARRPRGRARQAIRPHAGDPAPDRPQPARRGGPRRDGRDDHHARLRRAERRWRHALRRHHRRLGRAQPRLRASRAHERAGPLAASSARWPRSPAGWSRARRCSTSTMPRIPTPRRTPISC